jgi:ankyrin repeat protein
VVFDVIMADANDAGGNRREATMADGTDSDIDTAATELGMDELMRAAAVGDVEVVLRLLQAGSANVAAVDALGRSALMAAACNGHARVASMLLDAGANIEVADAEGNTSLICAVVNGHADVIRLLLEAGANAEAAAADGTTALMEAVARGYTEVVSQLLTAGTNVDATAVYEEGNLVHALTTPSSTGNLQMVMQLLEAGADPNAIRYSRGSPLPLAMFHGHEHVAEALLRAGAEVGAACQVLVEFGSAPKAARLRSKLSPPSHALPSLGLLIRARG